ncbi:MAG: hypothetical protein ACT4PS_16360 [Betaproteobacteria bacterium]
MEMVDEALEEPRLRDLFEDIKRTLSLSSINSDYRTLALWPDYLAAAWRALKPLVTREDYRTAANCLREEARRLARELPYPVNIRWQDKSRDEVAATTQKFEQLLPPLILNIALLALDARRGEDMSVSPFPLQPATKA